MSDFKDEQIDDMDGSNEITKDRVPVSTVRYEEDETDQHEENETVSLFVTARNTKTPVKSNASDDQAPLNSMQKTSTIRSTKNNKLPIIIFASMVSVIILLFLIVTLFAMFSEEDSSATDVKDINQQENIIEEIASTTAVTDSQEELLTPDDIASTTAVTDSQEELLTPEDIILDLSHYQESSGLTVYYPSGWDLTDDDDYYVTLMNTELKTRMDFNSFPLNISIFYDNGNATYEEMAVHMMDLDVSDLKVNTGTISDYTDSIELGDQSAYITADFKLTFFDTGVERIFHIEKMLSGDTFFSARLSANADTLQVCSAYYAAICGKIELN